MKNFQFENEFIYLCFTHLDYPVSRVGQVDHLKIKLISNEDRNHSFTTYVVLLNQVNPVHQSHLLDLDCLVVQKLLQQQFHLVDPMYDPHSTLVSDSQYNLL
jgi:hypothetical protein